MANISDRRMGDRMSLDACMANSTIERAAKVTNGITSGGEDVLVFILISLCVLRFGVYEKLIKLDRKTWANAGNFSRFKSQLFSDIR